MELYFVLFTMAIAALGLTWIVQKLFRNGKTNLITFGWLVWALFASVMVFGIQTSFGDDWLAYLFWGILFGAPSGLGLLLGTTIGAIKFPKEN